MALVGVVQGPGGLVSDGLGSRGTGQWKARSSGRQVLCRSRKRPRQADQCVCAAERKKVIRKERESLTAAISFSGLTKRYGARTAIEDVTFSVQFGEVTGLFGPNGAGKTTCLRILAGLVVPDRGTATVLGKPFAELPGSARRVGVALDTADTPPALTGRRHLLAAAAEAGVPARRVDEVLAVTDIEDVAGEKVATYSQGARRRLGLATALLGDPRVLILDEPAVGLDPHGVRWLRTLLRSLADQGCAVLLSSRALAEVEQTADRVIALRKRILFTGPVEALRRRSCPAGGALRVRTSDDARMAAELASHAGDIRSSEAAHGVLVQGTGAETILATAAAIGVEVFELAEPVASLEEEFCRLLHDTAPERAR
ncbi:ATP-binding cassette domain-containing protein [Streptomyces ipomoeae]|uniref:ATP-binding cassette domain-containing protein n=1 Tax=Streptomyces ipomoeae TaxID=103232 RepID=A0AAE9AX39_9ACTN|nr:ATP-binding cassette domain-containing protein [Streptomyces ipomoeae]